MGDESDHDSIFGSSESEAYEDDDKDSDYEESPKKKTPKKKKLTKKKNASPNKKAKGTFDTYSFV